MCLLDRLQIKRFKFWLSVTICVTFYKKYLKVLNMFRDKCNDSVLGQHCTSLYDPLLDNDLIWFDFDFWCLNVTFSNISAISCWTVLVVEETGVPGENHRHFSWFICFCSQCNGIADHHCVLEIIWSIISWYLYHLSFQKNMGLLNFFSLCIFCWKID